MAGRRKKKTPPRRQRLYFILFSLACLGLAAFLILNAFRDNIVFFRTPTEILAKPLKDGQKLRIGGMVKKGSLSGDGGNEHEFIVTDMTSEMRVKYTGLLPSLFREGQGVVAYGGMGEGGVFVASEILAKHDEKYMPPEVYKALKKQAEKTQ